METLVTEKQNETEKTVSESIYNNAHDSNLNEIEKKSVKPYLPVII